MQPSLNFDELEYSVVSEAQMSTTVLWGFIFCRNLKGRYWEKTISLPVVDLKQGFFLVPLFLSESQIHPTK